MQTKVYQAIAFAIFLVILALFAWFAIDVILIAFAGILLAILLNSIGRAVKKVTRMPYLLSLTAGIIFICGILALTFWLYSPLIAEQVNKLAIQLPEAAVGLRNDIVSFFGADFFVNLNLHKEFSITGEKFFSRVLNVFSTTLGSIIGFIIFAIIGLYMAFSPESYMSLLSNTVQGKKRESLLKIAHSLEQSLRWWLLGKILAMAVIGVLTFIGLYFLDISLAFILALLAALLTFIPYVGAILSALPAILIAFAQSPILAIYVIILYCAVQFIEGNFITPYIEQRTVFIPPAFTILAQMLMLAVVGPLGLALATPILVVVLTLTHLNPKKHHKLI